MALAVPFRMMVGIVFRDEWLMHLIAAQPMWETKIIQITCNDWDCKILSKAWIKVNTENTYLDVFVVPPLKDAHGFVKISLNPTSPKEMWAHRVECFGVSSEAERFNIYPYNEHADVARVISALEILLLQ